MSTVTAVVKLYHSTGLHVNDSSAAQSPSVTETVYTINSTMVYQICELLVIHVSINLVLLVTNRNHKLLY